MRVVLSLVVFLLPASLIAGERDLQQCLTACELGVCASSTADPDACDTCLSGCERFDPVQACLLACEGRCAGNFGCEDSCYLACDKLDNELICTETCEDLCDDPNDAYCADVCLSMACATGSPAEIGYVCEGACSAVCESARDPEGCTWECTEKCAQRESSDSPLSCAKKQVKACTKTCDAVTTTCFVECMSEAGCPTNERF